MVSLICEKYLQALNSGNLNSVLELFSEGAVVVSPLYGEMSACDFYKNLFQDTNKSETEFLGVYQGNDSCPNIIMHFNYKWTLKSNAVVRFECLDLFELTKEKDKFKRLKIIYDTYPIRKDFEENKKIS